MARTYPPIVVGQQSNPVTDINGLYQDVTTLTGQVFNVKESTWGAVGNGVTDDSAAINAAAAAANAAGGGTVFLPSASFKANNILMRNGVRFVGGGNSDAESVGATSATTIVGTAGQPTFVFPAGASYRSTSIENLIISGGDQGIYRQNDAFNTTYFRLKNVTITGAVEAGIRIDSDALMEEVYWENVRIYGGQYGVLGEIGRLDKANFRLIETKTQTINGWRLILTGATAGFTGLSSRLTWDDIIIHTCGQHGFYVEIDDACRSWNFNNPYSEGVGSTGKNNLTTGSVTTGTNTLTVASGTGFVNGDPLVVRGAGTGGVDLFTTVSSGGGTVNIVMGANALTTVAAVEVTNASYDEFHFSNALGSTLADIAFNNANLQGSVGGGKVRYGINMIGVGFNAGVHQNTVSRQIYDPNRALVSTGRSNIRHPDDVTAGSVGGIYIAGGKWNQNHIRLGAYHLWIDASGRLRIKATVPTSDTDGTVVGTQT